ncbi:glycosyltransferase [Thioalkalivibrio sulfidiphilus]|uniref:glycosyltransferase n=1 Tax=Thioalkalivibrio sulfidiphilus TaxID=1033854 RepID=UPI0018CB4604|nr:glycosyltransferase [Thioalkalivibrio sulfidiphilus]
MHIASGDRWAGAEVQLWTLLRHLNKRDDVRARAVLMNEGETADRLREAGIPVDVLDETQLNAFQILMGLRNLMRQHQPDIIHTHRQKENILGSIANTTTLRRPSVRTTHGAPEFNHPWSKPHKRLIAWLDWACGRYLQDRVIAVSQDLGRQLEASYPTSKIAVIENGVDIDTVLDLAQETPDFRQDQPSHKHIGIVGRLESVKRIDIFLHIAEHLLEQDLPWPLSFHVFGDGSLRSELENLSTHLGIADSVRFHGHRNDIAACIDKLDVLVICSDHEGLPMTLLEAMTLRTPVVAHDIGGLAEALAEEHGGLLNADHTADAYAEAVLSLLKDSSLKQKIQSNGFERVKRRYSAPTNAERVKTLYQKTKAPLNRLAT